MLLACVTTACVTPLGCAGRRRFWGGFSSLHGLDLAEFPERTERVARAVFHVEVGLLASVPEPGHGRGGPSSGVPGSR